MSALVQSVVLLPCPFCGGSDVYIDRAPNGQPDWVQCDGCGAHGPYSGEPNDTDAAVSSAWNRQREHDWNAAARAAIVELLDAYRTLDRDRLSKALKGLMILVGQ
jgi:Lar family restriction alleviation protein